MKINLTVNRTRPVVSCDLLFSTVLLYPNCWGVRMQQLWHTVPGLTMSLLQTAAGGNAWCVTSSMRQSRASCGLQGQLMAHGVGASDPPSLE